MSEMGAGSEPRRTLRTVRLEAFSDGVFAIAITLLVLEIAIPADSGDDLLRAVLEEWPSYMGYVVSFATIGGLWLAHTAVTDYIDRADAILVRLNLVLLLVVSFIPFPTRLLAEYTRDDEGGQVSTTIYGITFFTASLLVMALWRYAVREGLVRADVADEDVRRLTQRLTPTLGAYVVMIALGLFFPIAAVVGYLLIAVVFIAPFGILRRRKGD